MSPKYAKRVDNNHVKIRDTLRELGFIVFDTSKFGDGFVDLIVKGYHRKEQKHVGVYVEVKTGPSGKLSPGQEEWHRVWGEVFRIVVAYTLEDVLQNFGWSDAEKLEVEGL